MPRHSARREIARECCTDDAPRRTGALSGSEQPPTETCRSVSVDGTRAEALTGAEPLIGAEPLEIIEVWLVEIDQIAPLILDRAWPEGSAVEAARQACVRQAAASHAHASWPRERLVAHVILRLLLARRIGLAPALAPFAITPNGKPRLAIDGPAFSLAHSGKRALIALSGANRSRIVDVGTDLEAPRTPKLAVRRRDQIVAAGEAVAGGTPYASTDPDVCFLEAWVRLEAVAKYSGQGMAWLLGQFGIFANSTTKDQRHDWMHALDCRVCNLELDGGYFAAVAGPRNHPWKLELRSISPGCERLAAVFGAI